MEVKGFQALWSKYRKEGGTLNFDDYVAVWKFFDDYRRELFGL
jgi:hypothetical protein